MALSRDEREALLAEPIVAALSVAAGAGRGPLTVPIWYPGRAPPSSNQACGWTS